MFYDSAYGSLEGMDTSVRFSICLRLKFPENGCCHRWSGLWQSENSWCLHFHTIALDRPNCSRMAHVIFFARFWFRNDRLHIQCKRLAFLWTFLPPSCIFLSSTLAQFLLKSHSWLGGWFVFQSDLITWYGERRKQLLPFLTSPKKKESKKTKKHC